MSEHFTAILNDYGEHEADLDDESGALVIFDSNHRYMLLDAEETSALLEFLTRHRGTIERGLAYLQAERTQP